MLWTWYKLYRIQFSKENNSRYLAQLCSIILARKKNPDEVKQLLFGHLLLPPNWNVLTFSWISGKFPKMVTAFDMTEFTKDRTNYHIINEFFKNYKPSFSIFCWIGCFLSKSCYIYELQKNSIYIQNLNIPTNIGQSSSLSIWYFLYKKPIQYDFYERHWKKTGSQKM